MKKHYFKPFLFAERFRASEHIHASCHISQGFSPLYQSAQTCAARAGGDKVFLTSVTACLEPDQNGSSAFAYDNVYLEEHELTAKLKINGHCYSTSAGGPMFAS